MEFLIRGEDYLKRHPNFKLIDRKHDLERLSSILIRREANSVILVGPSGVGCTALCMGLQASKKDPNAPFDIVTKRNFWLDTDGLFSLGDSQKVNAAFDKIMRRLYRTTESVLIIEDTRDFIEGMKNNGSAHFINALALAIKNGKTQAILEARDEDLDLIFKAHSDMRELFTLFDLQEPKGDALTEIVTAQAKSLEAYHKVRIDSAAIETAIELTNKYRSRDGSNIAQPQRSVTLLDRALSSYRLNAHRNPPGLAAAAADRAAASSPFEIDNAEKRIAGMVSDWGAKQAEIRTLYKKQRDGEAAVLDLEVAIEDRQIEEKEAREKSAAEGGNSAPEVGRIANFAKLASGAGIDSDEVSGLKAQLRIMQEQLALNKTQFDTLTTAINADLLLSRDVILTEFSAISGIAASKLNQDERAKLRTMDGLILNRVFGQDHAVKRITNAIKTARVGRRNKDKPQAAFLLPGPSGVGKTEIAKALAAVLLDDETALTRFDMSEYMEKNAAAKLIGAPPGYEGFEVGGMLTNAMRKNPMRVILFDEIEKAHPDVFNLFLQVLDEGRLTDNVGRTVSFGDAVIIMTTNVGQVEFLDASISFEEASRNAMEELGKTYRSEFLNRFDGRQNIVCFKRLELPSIERIVRREFTSIDETYAKDGMRIQIADGDLKAFCAAHYDPVIGGRGLPGFIRSGVEPLIVDRILSGAGQGTFALHYSNDNASFDLKEVA